MPKWDEKAFHQAADKAVSDFVRRMEAALAAHTDLALLYNAEGPTHATCNVCLRDVKVLWIYADGRYNWYWHEFLGKEDKAVESFKKLVHSDNKSSYMPRGHVWERSPQYYTDILEQVASALTK